MENTPKELFSKSLQRCRTYDDFIDKFYDRFLSSSDEIREMFSNTDFSIQRMRLLKSLDVIVSATDGDAYALRDLSERAETHSRHRLNVKKEQYDLWLEALIATARECDNEFDELIENAWRTILGFAIRYMTSRY